MQPTATENLEIIMSSRNAWTVSQVFFALGSIVTAIGIGIAAYHLRAQPFSALLYLGITALFIGAVL